MRAATSGRLEPQHVFGEAFVQHADHLGHIALAAGVSANLLAGPATLAVAPVARAYAGRLLPLVDQVDDDTPTPPARAATARSAARGRCWPRFAVSTNPARCGAACAVAPGATRAARRAPYCGNTDQRSLGTLTVDGEQRFHAAVCERCTGYLKVGNALEPPPAELLPIDDVGSLQLDLAATERGYQRPSGSGYRIELAVPDDEWLEELE